MLRFAFLALIMMSGCGATKAPPAPPPPIQIDEFRVTALYPHDRSAFTEGLFYRDGHLYESTGLEGKSTISKVDLKTGKILKSTRIPRALFGEGIVDWQSQIISVTWKTGVGFRWDINTFAPVSRFTYKGEGWGMTQDGTNLILSDGTPTIRFLDPETFAERKSIRVTFKGRPIPDLNELEWVKGKIFANVWQSNFIVVIDPASGTIERVLDMSPLVKASGRGSGGDVLNGIAYDAETGRLWVTGKNWPTLFELKPVTAK
ncbi:MAG: glutaminyl-peptide cyclotransferase [Sphingomonadaceae bacterium]